MTWWSSVPGAGGVVTAACPADRLLVYEVSDGWDPLCEFLGVPVPAAAFPYTNTTEEFQSRQT